MQTFLPDPDFQMTARILDPKRLQNQRRECKQIILALERGHGGWIHHPAVRMWEDYQDALKLYTNIMIEEFICRGGNNLMPFYEHPEEPEMPWWLGEDRFHRTHRSNLLRKDPEYYSRFGWTEPDWLPYYWPVD